VQADSVRVDTSMGGEAYAQWVRRAITRAGSNGGNLIPLFGSSVSEPVDLIRRVVEEGFSEPITSRYQSVFLDGNPYLLSAIGARYRVPADWILPTTGATSALSIVYRAFLKPGDHVLVETPGFDLFGDIGRSMGAVVDHFERRCDASAFDLDGFAARLRPGTKLVVLSNLHNPSGMLLDDRTIGRIAESASRVGAKLVVDEVYGDYAGPAARSGSAVHQADTVISVNSLTKIYGLSSLRCGWVIAKPELLQAVREISDKFEFGVSKLSHAVAALVLEESAPFDRYTASVLATARPIMEGYFSRWRDEGLLHGAMPEHGCIVFPRLVGIDDTIAFSAWLADRHGVIVAPGEFFGLQGHVRIGFAQAPDELEFGLSRLGDGLRAWRALADAGQPGRAPAAGDRATAAAAAAAR
jgi:aspartate/methionine/tyrosine aminotransferase